MYQALCKRNYFNKIGMNLYITFLVRINDLNNSDFLSELSYVLETVD